MVLKCSSLDFDVFTDLRDFMAIFTSERSMGTYFGNLTARLTPCPLTHFPVAGSE